MKTLGVKLSHLTISKELQAHPDFPSLLSITDMLDSFGVKNMSFFSDVEKIKKLNTPILIEIHEPDFKSKYLTILREVSTEGAVIYNNSNDKWETITIDTFKKRWTTIALIAHADENSGEADFDQKVSIEKRKKIGVYLAIVALPLIVIAISIFQLINYGQTAILPISFLLTILAGTIISTLLLWYEVDENNAALKEICSAGKKTSCSAVLNSKESKFFGVSWSIIGFIYFTGSLLFALNMGVLNHDAQFLLSWLNVLALPYIIFSIFYQWKVVKQWCVLCLSIQATLFVQGLISFTAGWHSLQRPNLFDPQTWTITSISFGIPSLLLILFLPTLSKHKSNLDSVNTLIQLKNNSQIFETLLQKQRQITYEPVNLGIRLGNMNSKNKIIKVCNPYCKPCANAHPAIEELLHNTDDVEVRIIFTASNSHDDHTAPPVRHLLAIAEKNDEKMLKQALDDWYNAPVKNYSAFAEKYAMNGELEKQGSKLDEMLDWCTNNQTSYTPMFFVNGYELPEMYSISDLKYYFKNQ